MEQFTDIEFELNENVDVDEDLDLKCNSYEDIDVGADDLQLYLSLREKCPNKELFLVRIFLYSR